MLNLQARASSIVGLMPRHSTDVCQCQGNEGKRTSNSCSSTVLTEVRIQKFASWDGSYICTYHHIVEQQKQQAAILAATDENSAVTSAPKKQELL
jgi:hypothetical protein